MACGSWGIGGRPAFANRLDESDTRDFAESTVSSPMTHRLGTIPQRSGRIEPLADGGRGIIRPVGSPPAPR
jgi:hypothetical protein